jgi:hypothetical protein
MIALDPGTIIIIQGVGFSIWESGSFHLSKHIIVIFISTIHIHGYLPGYFIKFYIIPALYRV